MKKDKHLGIRIDAELLEQIKAMAAKSDRSTSQQVVKYIKEGLRNDK